MLPLKDLSINGAAVSAAAISLGTLKSRRSSNPR